MARLRCHWLKDESWDQCSGQRECQRQGFECWKENQNCPGRTRAGRRAGHSWVLKRLKTHPLGVCLLPPQEGWLLGGCREAIVHLPKGLPIFPSRLPQPTAWGGRGSGEDGFTPEVSQRPRCRRGCGYQFSNLSLSFADGLCPMGCPTTEAASGAGGRPGPFRGAHSRRRGRRAAPVQRARTPPARISAPGPRLPAGTTPSPDPGCPRV